MTSYPSAAPRPVRAHSSPAVALLQIRDLIYKTAGIFHANNKLLLLEDRCQKRMQVLGVPTLRDYYDCLTLKPMHRAELVSLLNEITIGETCFFRNRPQAEAVRNIVLPRIVEAKSGLPLHHIRIWCAGCSTGEEAYTLAIILLEEAQRRLKGWTFELLATDLNEHAIAHAKAGSYGDYSVRNLDAYFRQKYFNPEGDKFCVRPEVKSIVSFSRLNLFDDARMMLMKPMDIIMCCNVLIYFDADSKKKVLRHFCSGLLAHGYLFLGHAESLFGISDEFHLVHLPSATAYVKSEKGLADPPR
jgi:chemotaxis protein methyltransferase CheR